MAGLLIKLRFADLHLQCFQLRFQCFDGFRQGVVFPLVFVAQLFGFFAAGLSLDLAAGVSAFSPGLADSWVFV